jgi:hypothetical protein
MWSTSRRLLALWDVVHEHRAELEEKFTTTFAVLTTIWDVVRKLLLECSHNVGCDPQTSWRTVKKRVHDIKNSGYKKMGLLP